MAARDEIVSFCDQLLEIDRFDDYGPNGLQVPGDAEVSKLATGVSANRETLAGAVGSGAELVLVHHGLFWDSAPRAMTAAMRERLRTLFDADASLAAYHLPLDAHPEIGNNALICERLGLEATGRLAEHKGSRIGIAATSGDGLDIDDLLGRVEELVGRRPLLQGDGPARVKAIAIVSGAAADAIGEAAAMGLDALLTGEAAEHAMGDATDSGMHFIAAGHYATETLGVRRLGELVSERFNVEHEFIDVPNPV